MYAASKFLFLMQMMLTYGQHSPSVNYHLHLEQELDQTSSIVMTPGVITIHEV
jgi:hypothetical protein